MYSATCLVSTWVSTYSWLVSTPHSVLSSCTSCQLVLIVSTSDEKYLQIWCALQGTYMLDCTFLLRRGSLQIYVHRVSLIQVPFINLTSSACLNGI